MKYNSAFEEWLWKSEKAPSWKYNLENCDPNLFYELDMTQEQLERFLNKLLEYNVIVPNE